MLKKMVALVLLFAFADAQAIKFNIFGKKKQVEQQQRTKLEAEAQEQREQNQVNQLPLEATENTAEEQIDQEMHKGIIPAGIAFILIWFAANGSK